MNNPQFIVTAPHATVNPHDFDYSAKSAAEIIAQELNAELFRAPYQRDIVDLNRPEGRTTSWREGIIEAITPNTVLIDIHSYPADDEEWGKYATVILTAEGAEDKGFYNRLRSELQKRGLKTAIRTADYPNDIIYTAREAGAYQVALIEINEQFIDKEHVIAPRIAEAVKASL